MELEERIEAIGHGEGTHRADNGGILIRVRPAIGVHGGNEMAVPHTEVLFAIAGDVTLPAFFVRVNGRFIQDDIHIRRDLGLIRGRHVGVKTLRGEHLLPGGLDRFLVRKERL